MDKKVKRYYDLKQKQKELEQELSELRTEILQHSETLDAQEWEAGSYRVKLVLQERKEYDEERLYRALPDPEVWRLLSKPDAAKIAGLVKLKVISEEKLKETYDIKSVPLLYVERK